MSLKTDIEQDLKKAMLDGDKRLVSVLKSVKSAILYKEVADQKRDEGLADDEIINVLKKEVKSRNDALELYRGANETERADEEQYQINVIEKYLPEQISEEETTDIVKSVIDELGITNPEAKDMGRIISATKQKNSNTDGALVAKVVKTIINS